MDYAATLDRRQLLRLITASSATLYLPRSAHSQARTPNYPFAYGVASGSPTHEGVVLWTRLDPLALRLAVEGQASVRWEVAHDESFQQIVQSGNSQAIAPLGFSVHVELSTLAPDRWYFYRFMVGEAVSPVGRTRTFPHPEAAPKRLRLAYASCQKWEDGYFSAWRHMQSENLDAVLFLGDYIYEYPGTGSRLRNPTGGWVLTLENYRARYALYKSDPDLQAMHAACPWLLTWDDHEVQNDYAGIQAGDGFVSAPNFLQRRAWAYQAYYENMPLRSSVLTQAIAGLSQGAEMRIYSHVSFGRLAALRLLDARQYKDPQVCSFNGKTGSSIIRPESCPDWQDPMRSMLGANQERWLNTVLDSATAKQTTWNVLGQQSLLGPRDFSMGPSQKLWNDGWDGYSAARSRLTSAFTHYATPNPVILGGDVHENWVGHVLRDYANPKSKKIGVEFCGTSITSKSGSSDSLLPMVQENPHFVFAESRYRGYGVAEFTPERLSVHLRVLDDVQRKDSTVRTLASFVVESGRPEVLTV